MMVAIKKGDFIEIDYTAKLATENKTFDTTVEAEAKEAGVYSPHHKFAPTIICVGETQLVRGAEAFLEGKDIGKEYEFDVAPVAAFGPRMPKLIKLFPLSKFKDAQHPPFPGAQLIINGLPAKVRSVSGGRVLLDFNHPLAGKKLHYWIKIHRLITDKKIQAESLLLKYLPADAFVLAIEESTINITVKDKKQYIAYLERQKSAMLRLIKDIKKVEIK